MKIFDNINKEGKCFICNTNDDGEVTLIAIDGTQDGFNAEAEQVHVKCLRLNLNKDMRIVYQKLTKGAKK